MRRRADIGVWEIFLPDIGAGRSYKFAILGPDGDAATAEGGPLRLPVRTAPEDRVDRYCTVRA